MTVAPPPVALPPGAELHRWNRDFTWALPPEPAGGSALAGRSRFDEDGYVVVPGLVDPAALAELVGELDALEAEVDEALARRPDGRIAIAEHGAITFTVHPVLRSGAARRLASSPGPVALARDLVGPDVNLYWDQAVYKKPERPRRFPWHQDNGYRFVRPQHYLTCWIALTDADTANGCPWVLPGLHRHGTLRHRYVEPLGFECLTSIDGPVPAAGAVAAEVRAGDAVVFSSLTPHLTGPNRTGAVRKAYIVQYAAAGSRILVGDPEAGEPTGDEAADDPDRQFAVLRDGEPV